MIAAKKGYKDVVVILTDKKAKLDHVNEVSIDVHNLYYNPLKLELLYICIYIYISHKHTYI